MPSAELSRRERQIMDALHSLGAGGAREVAAALREPEAHDSIRVTLIGLERKGLVRHRVEGRRKLYAPRQSPDSARRAALKRITRTFFGGSPARAMVTLLDMQGDKVDDAAIDEIERWVKAQARQRKAR